jgi:hypothetical protein
MRIYKFLENEYTDVNMVKFSLCLIKHYGISGSGGTAPLFLTSGLDGCEWSASRPGRCNPGEIAIGTHWIGGWVGPRAGLDIVEKIIILPWPSSLYPITIPTTAIFKLVFLKNSSKQLT